jgi:hypothetical protein
MGSGRIVRPPPIRPPPVSTTVEGAPRARLNTLLEDDGDDAEGADRDTQSPRRLRPFASSPQRGRLRSDASGSAEIDEEGESLVGGSPTSAFRRAPRTACPSTAAATAFRSPPTSCDAPRGAAIAVNSSSGESPLLKHLGSSQGAQLKQSGSGLRPLAGVELDELVGLLNS